MRPVSACEDPEVRIAGGSSRGGGLRATWTISHHARQKLMVKIA